MRDVWDLPGQARAGQALRSAVARDDVGHAWAFVGPRGVGQQEAARALTAALSCPTPVAPGQPCGMCAVCDRCLRGAFAAYAEFVPTGASHRVDEVRGTWLPAASRSAAEGSTKVLRIVDADRMNETAANALLKGLEEPPPGTVWILDLADPSELPDTILSRCRSLAFGPWGPADLDRRARELGLDDPTDRAVAVGVAGGSPQALDRLAESGSGWTGMDHLRTHRSIPGRLRREGPGAALLAAHAVEEEVKQRTAALKARGRQELEELTARYADDLPRAVARQVADRNARIEREARTLAVQGVLDDLVGWFRDCLVVGAGGGDDRVLHADAVAELREDAEALGATGALRAVDLALVVREDLERNVGSRLAMEALFMELSTLTMAPAALRS